MTYKQIKGKIHHTATGSSGLIIALGTVLLLMALLAVPTAQAMPETSTAVSPLTLITNQTTLTKTVQPTTALPGGLITYTLAFANNDPITATNISLADDIPADLLNTAVVSSGVLITSTGTAPNYRWQIAPLAPGQGGIITITAMVNTPLAAGTLVTNSALLTSTVDITETVITGTAVLTILNAPPVAVDDTDSTPEETAVTIPVTSNDTDANGDNLTVIAVSTPLNGSTMISGTGSVVYTPSLDFNGPVTFTYTISDQVSTDTALVTVTVTAVNDPPTAVDDTALLTLTQPITLAVLANDSDVENDPLTITAVSLPSSGQAVLSGTTHIVYSPTLNTGGDITFTYTISDGQLSDTALVTVTVAFCQSIFHVDDSAMGGNNGLTWANAFTDLQSALATSQLCPGPNEIWVAEGIYTPGITRTDTFSLSDDLALYGGFAATETVRSQRNWQSNITVLSGDIDKNDTTTSDGVISYTTDIVGGNSYHIVSSIGVTNSTSLDGFYITGGYANITIPVTLDADLQTMSLQHNYQNTEKTPAAPQALNCGCILNDRGGGLYVYGSDIIISNTVFIGNYAGAWGGGAAEITEGSDPTFNNVQFLNNDAEYGGAVEVSVNSNPRFTDVQFINNTSFPGDGGAVLLEQGVAPQFVNVLFDTNSGYWGGAILAAPFAAPQFSNVTFYNNQSGDDGGALYIAPAATASLSNTLFTDNFAGNDGGGLYADFLAAAYITNTEFIANVSTQTGGAIENQGGDIFLTNSVLAGNFAVDEGGGIDNDGGVITMTNVTIADNRAATGLAGGLDNDGGLALMSNVVIWNNQDSSGVGTQSSSLVNTGAFTITYSLLQGWNPGGTGNLNGNSANNDPRFTNSIDPNTTPNSTGDYTLQSRSGVIDRGNTATCAPDDILGVARPQGIHCDMGAYEFIPPDLYINKTSIQDSYVLVGSLITYSLSFGNYGSITATDVIITDTFSLGLTNPTFVTSTLPVTVTTTPTGLTFAVGELISGTTGTITLTGWITDGLSVTVVTNTAVIAGATSENQIDDNSDQVSHPLIYCPVSSIIFVDTNATGSNLGTSWANAYTDLQLALTAGLLCAGPNEIWVATGVYTPGVSRTDTFSLSNDLALYGGFAATETLRSQRDWQSNITVLSGDIGGDDTTTANGIISYTVNIVGDNSYHVVSGINVTNTTSLDGFYITGGSADEPTTFLKMTNIPPSHHKYDAFSHKETREQSLTKTNALNNCCFCGCIFNDRGGGVYLFGSDITISNTVIIGNYAGEWGGGGADISEVGTPIFSNVQFLNNDAEYGGAAIVSFGSTPLFTNVEFRNNSSFPWDGGAVQIEEGGFPEFVDVLFDNNSAADWGGALIVYPFGRGQLSNVTFSNNQAADDGGAINVGPDAKVFLTDGIFSNNLGEDGAGLLAFNFSTVYLTNTQFIGNLATETGGAIENYGNVFLTNAVLATNLAVDEGGAIDNDGGVITMTNVTIADNRASTSLAGGIDNDGGFALMRNVIIWNNQDTTGVGTSFSSMTNSGLVNITYSLLQGWNPVGAGNLNGNNANNDPLFVTSIDPSTTPTSGGDYRLQSASAVIDQGNTATCPADDIRGVPRPQDTDCEMGAYEFLNLVLTATLVTTDTALLDWNDIYSNQYSVQRSQTPYSGYTTYVTGLITSTYTETQNVNTVDTNYFYRIIDDASGQESNEIGVFTFAILPGD